MPTIWFALVALMITAYVALDGFDLGVGAVYFFLGKSEGERQLLIRTIGPVWDANEVWLIAGGGTLFFSFPWLYASSFSGFYFRSPWCSGYWSSAGLGSSCEVMFSLTFGADCLTAASRSAARCWQFFMGPH